MLHTYIHTYVVSFIYLNAGVHMHEYAFKNSFQAYGTTIFVISIAIFS